MFYFFNWLILTFRFVFLAKTYDFINKSNLSTLQFCFKESSSFLFVKPGELFGQLPCLTASAKK